MALSPQRVQSTPNVASVAALALVWVRLRVVAIKVRNPVLVVTTRLVLKAVKCLCNAVCPSVVLNRIC